VNRLRDLWPVTYASLLALSFVGYPLVSGVGSVAGFDSRALSIAVRAFILLASLAGVLTATARNQTRLLRDPPLCLFFLVWAALLIRFVWDASIVPIPMDLPWFDDTLIILGAVLIPSVALYLVPTSESLHSARRLILMVGTLAAVLTLVAVTRVLLSEDKLVALGRIGTDTMNPVSLGQLGVVVVTVGLLAEPMRTRARVARLLDSWTFRWLTGLLGVALVVGSASKGPVLALVSVVIITQVSRALRRPNLMRSLVSVLATAIAGAAVALLAVFLSEAAGLNVIGRVLEVGSDPSTLDRLDLYARAMRQFESTPWIGSSFVELQSRYYPHNAFIEVLMATGILGFCFFIGMVLYSAASAFRLLKTQHAWLVMVYVQAFISSMFSGSVYFDPSFWCATLAVIGADRLSKRAGLLEPWSVIDAGGGRGVHSGV
jgi:O-antigen ligase